MYRGDIPVLESWLPVCSLDLSEYTAHLLSGGSSDGPEVLAASVAMNIPINVVMDDAVWSTALDGVELAFPTILLSSYDAGFMCVADQDSTDNPSQDTAAATDLSHLGAAAPTSSGGVKCLGRPLTAIPEYPNYPDSDRTDTNPDDLFTEEAVAKPVKIKKPEVAIPRSWLCFIILDNFILMTGHVLVMTVKVISTT